MDMFEQLGVLKKRIEYEILMNQTLLKLIRYEDDKPLENPDIDDVQELIKQKYINFKPINYDKVIQDTRTFIVTSFNLSPTYKRDGFVNADFYIRIITHNSLMDILVNNEEKSRVFSICSEINKSFLNARGDWLGKCDFKDFGEITTAQDQYGVVLKYSVTNFKC